MFNKECPVYIRARLIESYHRDDPKDGPRIKRLKSFARQLPIEVVWEEIDAWSTAQVSASLADMDESRS